MSASWLVKHFEVEAYKYKLIIFVFICIWVFDAMLLQF